MGSRNRDSAEFSSEAVNGAKQGFIGEGETIEFGELSKNEGDRMFIGIGEDKVEGRDKGFNGSVGSIQFGRKNGDRAGGLSGEEGEDREFRRPNGFIQFDRRRKSGADGLNGDERVDREFNKSNTSIQFGRKNAGTVVESARLKGRDRGFSRPNRFIGFSKKNKSGIDGLGGERLEGGDIRVGRSNRSIRFGKKNKHREGGLSGEEEESRGFSGTLGSISFGGQNTSGKGGFGGENIKIREGERANRIRGVFKENRNDGKRKFKGSVGGITFIGESGDKGLSKSNSMNINRTVENYGGRRFDSYNKDNGFSMEYSTGGENHGEAFDEFQLEKGEKVKWVD